MNKHTNKSYTKTYGYLMLFTEIYITIYIYTINIIKQLMNNHQGQQQKIIIPATSIYIWLLTKGYQICCHHNIPIPKILHKALLKTQLVFLVKGHSHLSTVKIYCLVQFMDKYYLLEQERDGPWVIWKHNSILPFCSVIRCWTITSVMLSL